jgi:preprotein translocase subunit SecD
MLFSILGAQTFNPGNWHNQFKVGLGLDLSSGTEVVLKAATPKGAVPSAAEMQASIGVLLNRVNGTGNSGAQVATQGDDQITVTVPGKAATSVVDLISTTAYLTFRPVLLIQPYTGVPPATTPAPATKPTGTPTATPSGTASTSATPAATPSASASTKASTSDVSAKLVSPATSPSATTTPKASTTAKASATPKASATASGTPTAAATPTASPTAPAAPTSFGDPTAVNAATMKLFDKLVCTPSTNPNVVNDVWKNSIGGYSEAASPWNKNKEQTVSCDANGTKYVLGAATLSGTELSSVNAVLDTSTGQWIVNIGLNSEATSAFGALTTNQYDKYFTGEQQAVAANSYSDDMALDQTAIVLDGDVTSAPETQGALTSGSFEITGPGQTGFSEAEATQLANVLKFGALPLTFTQQSVTSISPQVGHASLEAGLLAGAIGLFLVVLYLFYYYRGLGIVSVSSLVTAALLAYFSVVLLSKYQNFTMSLSAIAGLVVAIGITADSFIVYFERLRDEVRDGKALRPAVEAGWKRARRTILVSDTVSFLAAVLLYHFATSDVQGFAYTLGLTTIIDVVVVFLFTKPMVTVLAGTKFFSSGNKWSGLDPERLGAKTPWRSGTRRSVRSHRTGANRTGTGRTFGGSSSTTSKEA